MNKLSRTLPMSRMLEKETIIDPCLVRQEALELIKELEATTSESKWQFKKGFRLIEMGELLNEPPFIERGERFLNSIGFLI